MTPLEVLLLALALAVDAFSVGAALGLRCRQRAQVFRLAFHFGLFQALLPLLGALGGRLLVRWVAAYDHWVAFGLLAIIGLHMIVVSFRRRSEEDVCREGDPTRGWSLLGLSLAVSIDAFGAGVGMAMTLGWLDLAWAVVVIGLVTGLGTWIGMRAGAAIVSRVGRRVETFAGVVLVLLGFRMLWI